MDEIIIVAIQLAIMVGAFFCGKYLFPNVPVSVSEKLDELSGWAANFVIWAREFLKSSTGQEKMNAVVQKLKEIADEAGLMVTEDQLQAITQSAYEAMKAGEAEAEATLKDVAAVPAVNIYNTVPAADIAVPDTKTVTLTDNVPPGALEENEDGTLNTYDVNGNKTGTITKEEAEESMRAAVGDMEE